MKKRFIDYKKQLYKDLQNPQEATAYLNATLKDKDTRVFLLALKDVISSRGTISNFAKKIGFTPAKMYGLLSKRGNPKLRDIIAILRSLEYTLSLTTRKRS